MKRSKLILVLMVILICMMIFTGCRQADRVSYNLSQQADNFNVVRQLTVKNGITNDVSFQMTGKMSITADVADKQLEIIVEKEDGTYAKHFIGLSDNTTYVVEQISDANVSNYRYTLNYNPKMWIPVNLDNID